MVSPIINKAEPEKPDDPNKYITTVRVTAGLDGTEGLNVAGGRLDSMIHFNRNGEVLCNRSCNHERIGDGAFIDFECPSTDGSQPVTTEIRGGPDAVCVTTLATTWPDDSKFGWTGDWAEICGLPYYHSGIILSSMPNGESPSCMRLRDDPRPPEELKGRPPMAIKLAWHDFLSENGEVPSREDAKKLCGNSLKAYDWRLQEISLPTNAQRMSSGEGEEWLKRGASFHMGRSDDRLVISSRPGQNATALCEKPHSYGPDFVSLEEGFYCNMDTRETLPLCSSSITGDCFDVNTHSHVIGGGSHKPSIRARNPTNVIYW